MPVTPIKLTLYDPETSEVKREFTRTFIPWRLLKSAIKLSKSLHNLDENNLTDEDVDAIASLVVDVFGNQFTIDELNDGADLAEMMSVMQAVVSRARGATPGNPPKPAAR